MVKFMLLSYTAQIIANMHPLQIISIYKLDFQWSIQLIPGDLWGVCLIEKTDTKVTCFLIKHDLKYCKEPNISKGHSSIKPECVIFTESQSGKLGAPKTVQLRGLGCGWKEQVLVCCLHFESICLASTLKVFRTDGIEWPLRWWING